MKILITGVSGLVGGAVADLIVSNGGNVFGITNKRKVRSHLAIDSVSIPLTDMNKLRRGVLGNYDTLIHCAANHPSVTSDLTALSVENLQSVINLISLCRERSINKVIFCSSISVYGQIISKSITEKTKINNPTIYGLSKLFAEKMFSDWASENGTTIHNVRIPAVISKGCHQTFIIKMVEAIIGNRTFHMNNSNTPFNNIVHLLDLAEFLYNLSCYNYSSSVTVLGASNPQPLGLIVKHIISRFSIPSVQVIDTQKVGAYIDFRLAKTMGYKTKSTLEVIDQFLYENYKKEVL